MELTLSLAVCRSAEEVCKRRLARIHGVKVGSGWPGDAIRPVELGAMPAKVIRANAQQKQCSMRAVVAWSLPVHTPVTTHCSPLGPPKSGYSFALFVLLPPRFPSPRMWSSYAVYVLAIEPGWFRVNPTALMEKQHNHLQGAVFPVCPPCKVWFN
jgi:hypothetical protein